jgi:hypothetical protein
MTTKVKELGTSSILSFRVPSYATSFRRSKTGKMPMLHMQVPVTITDPLLANPGLKQVSIVQIKVICIERDGLEGWPRNREPGGLGNAEQRMIARLVQDRKPAISRYNNFGKSWIRRCHA